MAAKNEVANTTTGAVAPAYIKKGPARGSEHVGQEDLIIPRLELVQSLSPCRDKKDEAEYIEGAEEGMLYNSVTRELYGPEAIVVPVAFRKEYLLWKDRKKGGGFRGAFQSMAEATKARDVLPDAADIEINDTAQHFCLLINPASGKVEEIVMSLSRSKLKTSRKWNSLIRISEMDSFAKSYRVTAVEQRNADNQKYYGFDVENHAFVDEDVYKRAEVLWGQVEAGTVKVSTEGAQDDVGTGSETAKVNEF